jgi:hypothetical protein
MRSERMIVKCHPFPGGVIGYLFGRTDAADAARVDLDEPDLSEVDEVQSHGR